MASAEQLSTGAIPDLVNNIIQIVRQTTQLLIDTEASATDKKLAKQQVRLQNELPEELAAIVDYFNHYILVLGLRFSAGDGMTRWFHPTEAAIVTDII